MPKIYVSDAIHQERMVFGPDQPPVAPGWKALSRLYQASFAACGYEVVPVIRPEIYQTGPARRVLNVQAEDLHLVVKPVEHIRPFHGIPNVVVCNWPFPELSASSHDVSPFLNQVRLLNQADAVICATDFTAQVLRNAGVCRAVVLPPWIPPLPAATPSVSDLATPERQRFLLLANDDPRQLVRMIEGFVQAQARRDDLHLVVSVRDANGMWDRVLPLMGRLIPKGSVSFVEAPVDWTERPGPADFVLCGSPASGLDLRMAQTMLSGTPLITTMNSGMGGLLTPAAAIPIATYGGAADSEAEPLARHMHLTCNYPTIEGVREAVLVGADLDKEARSRMAQTARDIANRVFGFTAFADGLTRLGGFVPL